jgi:hypothetical protein
MMGVPDLLALLGHLKQKRQPMDETLPDGRSSVMLPPPRADMLMRSGEGDTPVQPNLPPPKMPMRTGDVPVLPAPVMRPRLVGDTRPPVSEALADGQPFNGLQLPAPLLRPAPSSLDINAPVGGDGVSALPPPMVRPRLDHPSDMSPASANLPAPALNLSNKLPLPGEENANDAVLQDRLGQYPELAPPTFSRPSAPAVVPPGVSYGLSDPASQAAAGDARRPYAVDRLAYEETHPRMSHSNRFVEGLKGAGMGFLRGGLGGALAGAVQGAVSPNSVARDLQHTVTIPKLRRQQAEADEKQKRQLGADLTRSQIRSHDAQAKLYAAKPGIEADKATAAALQRERSAVLGNLRLLKGSKLDPSNPRHMALLERAANSGIEVDADEWNNAKENLKTLRVTDLQDPTKRKLISFNQVTGEQKDVAYDGFQTPIHSDTELTANQEGVNADRDTSRANTERQRTITNNLSRARYNLSSQGFDLRRASQDARLSEQTRKELKDAHALQEQINKAQADADSYAGKGTFTGDDGKEHRAKWAVQKETDARNRADALKKQFDGTYGYLTEGGDAPAGAGAPAAGAPSSSGAHPLPRRNAPARGAAVAPAAAPAVGGARFTESDVRARARAKGKPEGAAVEAARRAGLLRQ